MAKSEEEKGEEEEGEEEAPVAEEAKNIEGENKDQYQKVEKKRKRGRQNKEQMEKEKTITKKKQSKGKEAEDRPEERWPVRERRQVVRFSVPTPERISLPKNPKIEQGPGTKLRDIPNVIFKLSKRKVDDNLNVLHSIIFGRKSNMHFLKRNILQFSGYVWSGNEEKERTKLKEKLDKCTKDKLVDFCQLFDIPLNKAIKKEEASAKLMEFLESPYVTRDAILAEKTQQGEKRKRTKVVKQKTSEGTSSDGGSKKRKGTMGSKVKNGQTDSSKVAEDVGKDTEKGETEDKSKKYVPRKKNSETSKKVVSASKPNKASPIKKGETEDKKDKRKSAPRKTPEKSKKVGASKVEKALSIRKGASQEYSRSTAKYDLKASSTEQGTSKTLAKSKKVFLSERIRKGSKTVAKENVAIPKKDTVKSSKKVSKNSRTSSSSNDNGSAQPSTSKFIKDDRRKGRRNEKPAVVDVRGSKREAISSISKVSTKEQGKLKKGGGKVIKGPSREEMLSVVSEIFKDVDFDVVTLSDILKQLESHFHVDLMARKDEVTSVIEEAINNMSDAEEDHGEVTKDVSGGKDGDE